MALTGAKLVWVETRAELDRAINDRTAMLFFLNRRAPGRDQAGGMDRVGKERGVPTFIDAAADIPPVEHLSRYVREGFDLVAFSGGKAIRGPQSSGLLLGRPDLIAAGRGRRSAPHGDRPGDEGGQGGDRRLARRRRALSRDRSRGRAAAVGEPRRRDCGPALKDTPA